MKGEIMVSEPWWPQYVLNDQRIAAGETLSAYRPITVAEYESLKSIRNKKRLTHSLSLLKILDQSQASLKQSLGDREGYLSEILSHYTYENTHLKLADPGFMFFGGLSGSPDGLRARTLIALMDHEKKEDAQKLLRSLMDIMKTGAFDTTPGDAWATVALRLFTQKYEKTKVNGDLLVQSGSAKKTISISEKNPKSETFLPIAEALGSAKTTQLNEIFTGTGSPWSFTLVEAAIPVTTQIDHGYSVTKTVTPVQVAKPNEFTRGDIYEVKLSIDARNNQTWIALNDPIPTGSSVLSTESTGGSIAFEERRMDRMQVFYEYLPLGKAVYTYKLRLNQQGSFEFPSTRLEAMYDPTEYGEYPNTKIKVNP